MGVETLFLRRVIPFFLGTVALVGQCGQQRGLRGREFWSWEEKRDKKEEEEEEEEAFVEQNKRRIWLLRGY